MVRSCTSFSLPSSSWLDTARLVLGGLLDLARRDAAPHPLSVLASRCEKSAPEHHTAGSPSCISIYLFPNSNSPPLRNGELLSVLSRPVPSQQAERSHLEQRLNAVEARVSEAVRSRADLSRRLAETAVKAEEAGVENQRLEHRVRVRGVVGR